MPTDLARGFWRLADPKISLASIASMTLGACAAAADGPLDASALAATVLGILAVEVAKNASGEVVDFDSGDDLAVRPEDRSPFSGGKRVLVDGLLTRRQTIAIAAVAYAVAIAIGLAIAAAREPRVLWLGLAGVGCAYFYHGWPVRLAYRGLGELAVAFSYGPLVCCGTYLVQRGVVPARVVWLSLPFALLVAAFLWICEFPDWAADRQAGKRTLVVRLGRPRASRAFAAIAGAALALAAALPLLGVSRGAWLGLVALVPAVPAVRTLLAHPETTARIVPAQGLTLLAFVLYALGAGAGVLVAG